ncbi:MAG: hypothetical protein HC821_04590 [Lewinella sp.]|nr:hypothetical protein [Lewinella sp.]
MEQISALVFGSIGLLFFILVLIEIGGSSSTEEYDQPAPQSPNQQQLVQPNPNTQPNVSQEPAQQDFTTVSNELLRQQLGNTLWYEDSLGDIEFSADGKTAVYGEGNGSVQIMGFGQDGYIYAQIDHFSSGEMLELAFAPPNGNTTQLDVYVREPGVADFNPIPAQWVKQ